MAANDYIRTVNITPLGTSYSWDTPPSWITITQVGDTDDWTITVAANTGAARNATLTVRHANTSTVDTITVSQAGAGASPTATPVVPTATPIPPTPTPIPPTPTSGSGAGAGPTATPAGTLVILDTSVFPSVPVTQITLDDYENGPGLSSETYTWQYSGSGTATPVVVSKDSKVSVSFAYGTQVSGLVVGSMTVTSNDPGAQFPVSMSLNDLIIARPDDANVTYSIAMSLIQGTSGGKIIPTLTPTSGSGAGPTPTSVSSGGGTGTPSPTLTPTPTTYSGGGGGGCLVAGTKITLADGTLVNIETLGVGQKLMSTIFGNMPNTDDVATLKSWTEVNPSITSTESELVSITSYNVSKTYNFNNGLIISSGDHLHVVKVNDSTWTVLEAENVKVGDKFMTVNGEVTINTINEDYNATTVYKLDVETNDTFIANGVVTHNVKVIQL